jgi:hypothetical protein
LIPEVALQRKTGNGHNKVRVDINVTRETKRRLTRSLTQSSRRTGGGTGRKDRRVRFSRWFSGRVYEHGVDSKMKKLPLLLGLMIIAAVIFLPKVHAMPSAQIQNDSSYRDSIGYYHVVGEVRNTGDVWLQYVKVTGVFKDAGGQVVDVDFTYTMLSNLRPNNTSPFDLIEIDAIKSAAIKTYSLTLDFEQLDTPPATTLTILHQGGTLDSIGDYVIVGEVENAGDQVASFTKVVATFYNVRGTVIAADFTFTSPDSIPPGQTYGFKLYGPTATVSAYVKSYSVTAESEQYASLPVPESPWPQILLAAGLTLCLVALSKRDARANTNVVPKYYIHVFGGGWLSGCPRAR